MRCCNGACTYENFFWSSEKPKKVRSFDINKRVIYAMRRIGNGYRGLKLFASLMDMPPPMSNSSYDKLVKKIHKAVKDVAFNIMKEAADEVRINANCTEGEVVDAGISNDGTWQKRGFSSLNGAVASLSIDTGKVLDIEVMSRYCNACINYSKYKDSNPEQYKQLTESHEPECMVNHRGSAPAMEVEGTVAIYNRSISKNGLRYVDFYGDGDTKSFKNIENTYPGTQVRKLECIGYIQKRVGNRLRKLKKSVKGLGGKGVLNDAMIDKLQNYYVISIRRNVGKDVATMKSAIWAGFFHVASSKNRLLHDHCLKGKDSWCGYQLDVANKTELFKHGAGISDTVIKHIKPILVELSNDSLLQKCLHGKTQNQNESFNGTIWRRVPKHTYVGLRQFELGVYDAVSLQCGK